MRRVPLVVLMVSLFTSLAGPALACGGLIGPNGAVNLLRTTTLAAWHNGYEHYVTAFRFAGGGGAFGSLVPLPGVPTNVERGGDWTLQRLVREVQPPQRFRLAAGARTVGLEQSAEVLYETRIDALDISILKGGAREVGLWAKENGFRLPPDAPEVLEFYATRSPIFMAARFDADAAQARGQSIGDGTPIHLTIPLDHPWVPLRILGLGKQAQELVAADVFLLTPGRPSILPGGAPGMSVDRSRASDSLLDDLRSDKGMEWIPEDMWLSHVKIDMRASDLTFDLATAGSWSIPPAEKTGISWFDSWLISMRPALWLYALAVIIAASTLAIHRRRNALQ